MVSLLEIIWFIVVFALFTLSLATSLDGAVGVAVVGTSWSSLPQQLSCSCRAYSERRQGECPRRLRRDRPALVDSYGNIQTLKLFPTPRRYAGTRAALSRFSRLCPPVHPHAYGYADRGQSALRVMLTVIATLIVSAWQAGTVTTGVLRWCWRWCCGFRCCLAPVGGVGPVREHRHGAGWHHHDLAGAGRARPSGCAAA
ncbi:MAG: hypothetical protein HPM95_14735 [Alphaproteobacteria bacterium]|nr:hypothetical protein [Alphaproteobacteria bacterium]